MTDYTALAAEASLAEYAGMTDAQIATAIRAKMVTVYRDVDPADWFDVLLNSGEWGRIELFSRLAPTGTLTTPSAQDGNVARLLTFVRAVTFSRPIRTARDDVRATFAAVINAMVSGGFLTADTRTALVAFVSYSISRAAQLGFPNLNDQEIKAARQAYG